jgi:DeoR/GlpR family transcriptional regulator of sugar metabolism
MELLFVSEATIRRDLSELEKEGQINKIYGGATIIFNSDKQIPLYVREKENNDVKKIICEQALSFINDGQVLFIDGSSTSQILAKHLYNFKNIIVITNGLKIAEILGEYHIKTYCTGGCLIDNSYVFAGKDAENFINNYCADICFISCKGMDENGKFTDTSKDETELRKCFLKNSKKRIMLLTDNKIGKTYLHKLCESTDIDVILTNATLSSTIKTRQ